MLTNAEQRGKSLADIIKEQQKKHGTENNTRQMFKPGDPICVITPCQDFCFFTMEKTFGYVLKVSMEKWSYGLWVKIYDRHHRHFREFNFEPRDVIKVDEYTQKDLLIKNIKDYYRNHYFSVDGYNCRHTCSMEFVEYHDRYCVQMRFRYVNIDETNGRGGCNYDSMRGHLLGAALEPLFKYFGMQTVIFDHNGNLEHYEPEGKRYNTNYEYHTHKYRRG